MLRINVFSKQLKNVLYNARYRKAHREERRKASARYRKAHPEKMHANRADRRAREFSASGDYTSQWPALLVEWGNRCLCCGRDDVELASLGLTLSPDHVQALTDKGSNDISNIQPLCHGRGGCNNRKYTKHIDFRGVRALFGDSYSFDFLL